MTVSKFCSYCRDHGVSTNKQQLELYDRFNLLAPALIVFYPIGTYQKIHLDDGKEVYRTCRETSRKNIYYHPASIMIQGRIFRKRDLSCDESAGENDALDRYETFYPAQNSFKPWRTYSVKNQGFVKTKKELGHPAELYFSPEQIFPLIEIQRSHRMLADGLIEEVKKEVAVLQNIIQQDYRAIKMFHLGEDIWLDLIKTKAKIFNDQKEENELSQADFEAMIQAWEERDKKPQIEAMLEEQGVTTHQLRRMAELFVYPGFFCDPNIEIFEYYWTKIPMHLLEKQKGATRLAALHYQLAKRLLWLLDAFEKKLVTLDEYYRTRGHRFMESCVVCGAGFQPSKTGGKPQRTCGNFECVRINRNDNKRKRQRSSR